MKAIDMAAFKVVSTWRGKRTESEPMTKAMAHNLACEIIRSGKCKALTVLREAESRDGIPTGQFFLHTIWK